VKPGAEISQVAFVFAAVCFTTSPITVALRPAIFQLFSPTFEKFRWTLDRLYN
jgi:hypothetical protein